MFPTTALASSRPSAWPIQLPQRGFGSLDVRTRARHSGTVAFLVDVPFAEAPTQLSESQTQQAIEELFQRSQPAHLDESRAWLDECFHAEYPGQANSGAVLVGDRAASPEAALDSIPGSAVLFNPGKKRRGRPRGKRAGAAAANAGAADAAAPAEMASSRGSIATTADSTVAISSNISSITVLTSKRQRAATAAHAAALASGAQPNRRGRPPKASAVALAAVQAAAATAPEQPTSKPAAAPAEQRPAARSSTASSINMRMHAASGDQTAAAPAQQQPPAGDSMPSSSALQQPLGLLLGQQQGSSSRRPRRRQGPVKRSTRGSAAAVRAVQEAGSAYDAAVLLEGMKEKAADTRAVIVGRSVIEVPNHLLTAAEEGALLALVAKRRLIVEAMQSLARADPRDALGAAAGAATNSWEQHQRLLPASQQLVDRVAAELGIGPQDVTTWATEGGRAAQLLVRFNTRLCIKMAQPYSHMTGMPMADMLAAALTGLSTAVQKFRPSSEGRRLTTYATHWVRLHLQRTAARQGSLVVMPYHVVPMLIKAKRMQLPKGGAARAEALKQLSAEHPMTVEAVEAALSTAECTTASLDAPSAFDRDGSFGALANALSYEDLDEELEPTVGQSSVRHARRALAQAGRGSMALGAGAVGAMGSGPAAASGAVAEAAVSAGGRAAAASSSDDNSSSSSSGTRVSWGLECLVQTPEEEQGALLLRALDALTAQERYLVQRMYLDPPHQRQQQAQQQQQQERQQAGQEGQEQREQGELGRNERRRMKYIRQRAGPTLAQIGAELGMSKERARVVKVQAIRKLQLAVHLQGQQLASV